ncbi:MAG TPA: hypothetical protein VEZ11_16050 [Thermoanaerobaculia bacterium]|nr:hypothetical protein [Thermoanaerobaculia bacterium]
MRNISALLLCTIAASAAAPAVAQTSSLQIHGFLTAREIYVKAPPSWIDAGFGRFDVGADSPNGNRTVNLDVAQVGLDWTPARWLLLHADGVARKEPSGTKGSRGGLVQAYAELHNEHWRLRAGSFWLPTSRENVDPLWNSRYTITYSALNTWIGEEVRPVGADLQYSLNYYISLGATAFRGNDTMGTELADRGWTFGNRLSVYNENLPQPLPDADTTRPIGEDLDHRNGYSERIRVQLPERAMLQATHIDNRAKLIPSIYNQTPWHTQFNVVGGDVGSRGPATLAAEWASGWTEVGFPGGSFKMDFETAYVLLSYKRGADRWSGRVDHFSTRSHIRTADDASRESGHAFTLAWLRDAGQHIRLGLEYARVTGNRPGAVLAGADPRTGGSTITIEVRYGF